MTLIENRDSISASFEPLQAGVPEALCVGRELAAKPSLVRGQRILLVDDEESVRAAMRMLLEIDGHQVAEASNGAEALNLFTHAEFDLVITDFQMPEMRGNELAVSIKLLAPSLPVLMITASDMARDTENPADAFLNKPFMLPELRCALGKLLRPGPARLSAVPV